MVKNPPANAGDLYKRHGFDPWVGKMPWRRAWQPTAVFLLGEPPWTEGPGIAESDTTKATWHIWRMFENLSEYCSLRKILFLCVLTTPPEE